MSEKELLKALEEDTKRECSAILENARQEAEVVVKGAEEEAEKAKRESLERVKASVQGERIRRLAHARLHAQEVILRQRQLAITGVFEEAGKRLKELRKDEDYPDIVQRLFQEAMHEWRDKMAVAVGERKAQIIVAKQDVPLLKDLNNKTAYEIIPDETGDISPGVVMVSKDKKYKIVNTLSSRLEKAKPELVSMIDSALFSVE